MSDATNPQTDPTMTPEKPDDDTDCTDQKTAVAHLYSALNDGDLDDVAHKHVSRAYRLLADSAPEGDESPAGLLRIDANVNGSFVAEELYPDWDDLARRVREHASHRFASPGVDTSPETW